MKKGNKGNEIKNVMLNLFQHPLHFLYASKVEILNQVQDDNGWGFTLIELLVVVLIIGILAAVAVPQYKVAVEKAHLTEALTVIKSIKEAQERYYLTNGDYTGKIEDLDISFPFAKQSNADDIDKTTINLPSGITVLISSSSGYVYAMNNTKTNQLVLYYFKPDSIPQWQCGAKQTDTTANRVCKSLGGKYRKNDKCAIGDCTIYSL